VLLYGVSGASEIELKLKELGIPYLYIGEYLEQHPLGKAEWMIFVAELVGRRAEAEALFSPIEARYKAIASQQNSTSRPRVMFNSPYRDSWFMPPATSYLVQLVTDAGGAYVYTDDGDNRSDVIDLEEAYLLASEADLWLNPGVFFSLKELCQRFPRIGRKRTRAWIVGKAHHRNLGHMTLHHLHDRLRNGKRDVARSRARRRTRRKHGRTDIARGAAHYENGATRVLVHRRRWRHHHIQIVFDVVAPRDRIRLDGKLLGLLGQGSNDEVAAHVAPLVCQ
jgi:hypothetical protein